MEINKKNMLPVVVPAAIGLFLWLITIPIDYIFAGLAVFYALWIIIQMMREGKYSDEMERAWNYIRQWWMVKTGEDLGMQYGEGIARYFGKSEADMMIAFKLMRPNDRPFVAVVKLNPNIKILNWVDEIEDTYDDRWKNPFLSVATHFTGTPSPTISADFEVSLQAKKHKKEKKNKEEKKSEEEGNYEPVEE